MAQLIRVHVQRGSPYEALDLELPSVRDALPAAEAELVSSRGLALAVVGRTQDAQRAIEPVRALSRAIEPAVLISAVDAVCALKEHASDAIDLVVGLERVAFTRGGLDLLVTTYRASPELLSVLLRASADDERLWRLIRRVGDTDLAEFLGFQVRATGDRRLTLTRRERDVYDLLVQDMQNREIGKLLFIEESTVKAHAHRIYDKLGVRSRKGLVVQALLERTRQATSATGSSPESSDEAP
jgi:LuxR family transcriptional regulator of spore coat protein